MYPDPVSEVFGNVVIPRLLPGLKYHHGPLLSNNLALAVHIFTLQASDPPFFMAFDLLFYGLVQSWARPRMGVYLHFLRVFRRPRAPALPIWSVTSYCPLKPLTVE